MIFFLKYTKNIAKTITYDFLVDLKANCSFFAILTKKSLEDNKFAK